MFRKIDILMIIGPVTGVSIGSYLNDPVAFDMWVLAKAGLGAGSVVLIVALLRLFFAHKSAK